MKTVKSLTTPTTASHLRGDFALAEPPTNLMDGLGGWDLVGMALDAVQAELAGTRIAERVGPGDPCPPMMLTLLTYCYAVGVYASADVELACENRAQVRYICARQCPSAETIRRFRRVHRLRLERCLARVLAEAWKREAANDAERPPESGLQLEAPTPATLCALVDVKLQLAVIMDLAADD